MTAIPALKPWIKRVASGVVLAPIVVGIIWKGGPLFTGFTLLCALICLYEWINLSLKARHRVLLILAGIFYISASFWMFWQLREYHSIKITLLFVIMLWASDTGAYLTGKSIGGPKMSPEISPNKTWAGFAGATMFPGLAGAAYILSYNYIYDIAEAKMDIFVLIFSFVAIGALVGTVGQAGDLLISWFKRHVRVKDAGYLIPGHGGLLDRVDAMMLSVPIFLFFVTKFPYVFTG